MKQRIITGVSIILVIIPILLLGGTLLHISLTLIVAMAVFEILRSVYTKIDWLGYIALYIIIVVLTYCDAINFIYYLGLFTVGLFFVQIYNRDTNIGPTSYVFLISVLISLALRAFLAIYNSSLYLFLMITIGNYLGDTGAYFVGSFFGKRKLIPEISPNKTVEGFFGGFFLAAIFSLIFSLTILKLSFLRSLISALVIGVAGQIGDLSFSVLKRKFKIKDFGSIFPGHGGVLDRVDSLLFNLLIYYSVWELISRWNI